MNNFLKENNLEGYIPLASVPELLTLINKGKCERFIYPDPPLGNEELEILNSYKNECYFTPLLYLNKTQEKKELKIAISISESQDIELFNQRLYSHEELNDEHIGTALKKAFRELGVL